MFNKNGRGVFFDTNFKETAEIEAQAEEIRTTHTRTKGSQLVNTGFRRGTSGERLKKFGISETAYNMRINIIALIRQGLLIEDDVPYAICACTNKVMKVQDMDLDHIKEVSECHAEGMSAAESHRVSNIQYISKEIHRKKKKLIKAL